METHIAHHFMTVEIFRLIFNVQGWLFYTHSVYYLIWLKMIIFELQACIFFSLQSGWDRGHIQWSNDTYTAGLIWEIRQRKSEGGPLGSNLGVFWKPAEPKTTW